MCLRGFGLFRTPRLELPFREYFRQPRQGALWRPARSGRTPSVRCRVREAQDEESRIPCIVDNLHEPRKRSAVLPHASSFQNRVGEVPYFVERIDSVVGGQVATALAIHTGDSETPVAAATTLLNSLDRAVPPQHVDFAVVDRETGRTLFHSDDDLAMTTNFAEDVGGDPALWSLLRSRATDTIGLVYAGIPIRAHIRPLRPGMPWTLIVYRGHELEDRLTTVTTALSILYTLLGLIGLGGVVGLSLLVVRWWAPDMLDGLPVMIGRAMATGARLLKPFAILVGVVLLFLLSGPFLAFAPGPPSNPWVPWNPWNVAGGSNPWPLFPFFAVGSAVVAALFLMCCALGPRRSTKDTGLADQRLPKQRYGDTGYGAGTFRRVLALAVVLAGLAVVPAGLSFGYHRAALGAGLNHYLADRTLESVARAREDYRIRRFREHGVAVAPAGDRTRYRVHEELKPEESWVSAAVRPLLASSRLSNELLIYRNLTRPAADDVASLHGAFEATFGYDVAWPLARSDAGRLWLPSTLLLILIAASLAGAAYSLCAVCTIVRSRSGGVVALPDACHLLRNYKHSVDGPLRAIVLYRSERDRNCLVERLKERLEDHSLYRYRVRSRGHGQPRVVNWIPQEAPEKPALYIFDDLEAVLQDDADGRVLFDELQRLVDGDAAVLVWSRVGPDYRYSDRFRPADRWFKDRTDGPDRRARWACLARKFRSCVLRCSDGHGKRFDQQLSDRAMPEAVRAMRAEAVANPDLLHLAVDVVADVRQESGGGNRKIAGDPRADARHGVPGGRGFALQPDMGGFHARRAPAALRARELRRGRFQTNGGPVQSPEPGPREGRPRQQRGLPAQRGVRRVPSGHDVDHGELNAWRKEDDGGTWQFIWPPLAVGSVLGLVFLAMGQSRNARADADRAAGAGPGGAAGVAGRTGGRAAPVVEGGPILRVLGGPPTRTISTENNGRIECLRTQSTQSG